jgi:hypothetical protein
LEGVGLEASVTEGGWEDIPARTAIEGFHGKGVWTKEDGGRVFDEGVARNGFQTLPA